MSNSSTMGGGDSGSSAGSGIQSGLVGAVTGGVDGGELEDGKGFMTGQEQLDVPTVTNSSDKIRIRETTKYFIFTFFIVDIIVACGQN